MAPAIILSVKAFAFGNNGCTIFTQASFSLFSQFPPVKFLLGLGRFNQIPKLRVLLEGFVFFDGQGGTVEEIFEGIFAEDAVDDDAQFVPLEINAIVANAKAMQNFAVSFQLTEVLEVGAHDFLGQPAKFAKDIQLKFLGHTPQLGGAG